MAASRPGTILPLPDAPDPIPALRTWPEEPSPFPARHSPPGRSLSRTSRSSPCVSLAKRLHSFGLHDSDDPWRFGLETVLGHYVGAFRVLPLQPLGFTL